MSEPTRRQSRRKSIRISKRKMNNYFSEYCDNTSIHGFKYLGEQDRSCIEKLWWLITITCSLAVCLYLIFLTYQKWDKSPVIVSFATKQTPIWQIPFPSVTICPETKARQSKYNLTQMYHLIKQNAPVSYEDRLHFEYVSLICSVDNLHFTNANFDNAALEFIEEIAPTIESTIKNCKWNGEDFNCAELFTPIWTDEGVCFTFNMVDREELFKKDAILFYKDFLKVNRSSEWSLIDGYKNEKQETYPRRALFSGAKAGLMVDFVSFDRDLDYICGDSLQGYKVLLTHPAETPRVSQQYFRVPLNQSVVAAVKPDIMATSESLQSYPPDRRKCYFPHERQLHFFTIYTQQNCEVECLSNFTYAKCGCVDFHMPRDKRRPICGPARIDCMKRARNTLLTDIIDELLKEEEEEKKLAANKEFMNPDNILKMVSALPELTSNTTKKKRARKPKKPRKCDCLPACTSLKYNIETSQTDYEWVKRADGLLLKNEYESEQSYISKLIVFFKDTQFITSERNELYGKTDFLANCGGLLGLFTGFSVISLVEIIYFLTLRCLCNIRLHGKKYWAGSY